MENSCIPPINKITLIVDGQPLTGSPNNNVLTTMNIIEIKAIIEIIIPTIVEMYRGQR